MPSISLTGVEIKGAGSLRMLSEGISLTSSSFQRLLKFLGLWPCHPNLCLSGDMVSSSSVCLLCPVSHLPLFPSKDSCGCI